MADEGNRVHRAVPTGNGNAAIIPSGGQIRSKNDPWKHGKQEGTETSRCGWMDQAMPGPFAKAHPDPSNILEYHSCFGTNSCTECSVPINRSSAPEQT